MHLFLENTVLRLALRYYATLHLEEGAQPVHRLLVSAETGTLEHHRRFLEGLWRARYGGAWLAKIGGVCLGRWRVVDLPVSYRLDEGDESQAMLFELEKIPGLPAETDPGEVLLAEESFELLCGD